MKDEYNLLNSVKVDLKKYKIEEVSELEKTKIMNRFKKSYSKKIAFDKKKVIAAVVALILAVNLGVQGDKVLAAAKRFKYSINSWLGFSEAGEKYSNEIGKTLEKNGVKITLNEFFTDNQRVILNFNITKNKDKIFNVKEMLVPDIYINGKNTRRSSDYIGYRVAESKDTAYNENLKKNKDMIEKNVTIEFEIKDLTLESKEDVKVVFSNLAKEYSASNRDFTYKFSYDSSKYKKDTRVINVNKNIIIGDNKLSLDKVTVKPDRVVISGNSKGFSAWENNKKVNYYYDIVDEKGDTVPLKAEIGNNAFFYRYNNEDSSVKSNINILKIIPYTFEKINTNKTSVTYDGKTKYIIEDKIITIQLN
ncbi:DUF4179 domain-containing protein [Haloimpatiens sp. FM7315]|uniref:DUF4179 domain-containing protein n=1 Tax=Haloimpatiens sp. FM7315 TaxID=3298609 RepID=UPI0035A2D615